MNRYFANIGFEKLVEALPSAGSSPYAFVAYLALVGAFLQYSYRKSQSKDWLKTLELLAPEQRYAYALAKGYNYDELSKLSDRDRLKLIMAKQRHLISIVAIVCITALMVILIVEVGRVS